MSSVSAVAVIIMIVVAAIIIIKKHYKNNCQIQESLGADVKPVDNKPGGEVCCKSIVLSHQEGTQSQCSV